MDQLDKVENFTEEDTPQSFYSIRAQTQYIAVNTRTDLASPVQTIGHWKRRDRLKDGNKIVENSKLQERNKVHGTSIHKGQLGHGPHRLLHRHLVRERARTEKSVGTFDTVSLRREIGKHHPFRIEKMPPSGLIGDDHGYSRLCTRCGQSLEIQIHLSKVFGQLSPSTAMSTAENYLT